MSIQTSCGDAIVYGENLTKTKWKGMLRLINKKAEEDTSDFISCAKIPLGPNKLFQM